MELCAGADWRSDAPYSGLTGCDAALFAWEWLRRTPAYRRSARGHDGGSDAACFGLHRFEDPDCPAPQARIWWRADADPSVLCAVAEPSCAPDAFDLARLSSLAVIERDDAIERLLVGNGQHLLRIDVTEGTLDAGPVRLTWRLAGLEAALVPLTSLRRLVTLHQTGRLVPAGYPSASLARRWARLLRVHDALASGAAQRDIAQLLYGAERIGRDWRIAASSYRLRVQRLVRAARAMTRRDPRLLLAGTVRVGRAHQV